MAEDTSLSALAVLRRLVSRQTSPYGVGLVRALVGLAALLQVRETVMGLKVLSRPGILRLPRADWPGLLPPAGVRIYVVLWLILAISFSLGWHTRIAGIGLCAILAYPLMLDHQIYQNHVYLLFLMCLLLTVANSGAAVSLDSRRRGVPPTIAAWPVDLIKVQVTLIYAFAALAKLNYDYLSGSVIDVRIASGMGLDGGEQPLAMVFAAVAGITVILELFLAVGFWLRRLRPYAVCLGVVFHFSIFLALGGPGLVVFGMTMIASYILFAEALPIESLARDGLAAKSSVPA